MSDAPQLFYHIACMNNWRDVVAEHAEIFAMTGLSPIVGLLGSNADADEVADIYGWRIDYIGHRFTDYETPTLQLLWTWCNLFPSKSVVYCHTKGVSRPSAILASWRWLMNEWTLRPVHENAKLLESCDAVGADWRPHRKIFSGNFWLARASWIVSLLSPAEHRASKPQGDPRHAFPWARMHAERWLASRDGIRIKSVGEKIRLGYQPAVIQHAKRLNLWK